jgi:hypothetical protein
MSKLSTKLSTKLSNGVLGAVIVLAACADSSITSSTGDTQAPTTTITVSEGSTQVSSEQIDPGLRPYIDIAVADLAQRLSIDAAEISVASATLQQWSDSSLGCPEPGRQYAQVVTDGSLIVLGAGGKEYRYHAGGSRPPFLCEQPAKATPTTL